MSCGLCFSINDTGKFVHGRINLSLHASPESTKETGIQNNGSNTFFCTGPEKQCVWGTEPSKPAQACNEKLHAKSLILKSPSCRCTVCGGFCFFQKIIFVFKMETCCSCMKMLEKVFQPFFYNRIFFS